MKLAVLILSFVLICIRCFAIDVAYVCNDSYAHMLATSVESMLDSKSEVDDINIFVLQHDFTEKTISDLTKLVGDRAHIQFIKFNIDQLKDAPDNFDIMTYAKILIFDKLPHLDKVLYIDSDTLIVSSLAEFYDTDLGDNYAGVVQDQQYFGGVADEGYDVVYKNIKGWFNAGVMLLNMKKCLKDDIPSKFFYHMKNVKHFYGDQPIFNYLFGDKIVYVGLKWNAVSIIFLEPRYRHPASIYSDAEFQDALKAPAIVHLSGRGYVSARHPWHVNFFMCLRKTPWRHVEKRLLTEMYLRSIALTDLWEIIKVKYF